MRPCKTGPSPTATIPRRRGSALITVILVVLVLTVVGLGIAYFTSTEDKISGNAKMSRVGFYAAEAGLRQAEALVTNFTSALGGNASSLLTGTGSDVYAAARRGTPGLHPEDRGQ